MSSSSPLSTTTTKSSLSSSSSSLHSSSLSTTTSSSTLSLFLSSISKWLDDYFDLSKRNTTVMTEFRAGTASFLTLSYLLLVNPQIMVQAGVSHDDAVLATAVSASVSCFIIGIFGNLPFGCAPGLGLSAYLAFGLIQTNICSLADALSICWWSGIFVLVISLSGLSAYLMKIVPHAIKLAIVVGMGLLIAMIGMVSIELIVANPKTLVELGNVWNDFNIQLSCGGLLLVASLIYHDVKGAVLIGIITLTIVDWIVNHHWPNQVFQIPTFKNNGYWNPAVLWDDMDQAQALYPALFSFVLICIFDISGVLFGLATLGGLMEKKKSNKTAGEEKDGYYGDDESKKLLSNGNNHHNNNNNNNDDDEMIIPGSLWAFIASGIGTMIAAYLGSTPIIVCVECASGVKEGGRTGLTTVVMGMYFLASVFLAPFFSSVPELATAPVLVLVGVMMMSESSKIDWNNMQDALPAFLTIILMPLTYSITNGMIFGLLTAIGFYFTSGQFIKDAKEQIIMIINNNNNKNNKENNNIDNGDNGDCYTNGHGHDHISTTTATTTTIPTLEHSVLPTPREGHGNNTVLGYGSV